MSEFTSGNLLLAAHQDAIRKIAVPGSILKVLDETWIAYLTSHDDFIDRGEAPSFILQLSALAPVLSFCNFADHCWGHRIFSEGKEVANLTISYEMEEELFIRIFEEKYPDKEIVELYTEYREEIENEITEHQLLEHEADRLFENCNVDAFRLFNVSAEQIAKLRSILNPDYYREIDHIFEHVEEFKDALGINEMSWIRYELIEENEEFDEKF